MFGTSGIRGPVGDTVTADLALRLGRAVGSTNIADTVVLGRDPRLTGQFLSDALSAGLRETGVDVIDVGVAASPTVARSVAWQNADVGITVTASHNPPADNGFKFWMPSGQAFDADHRQRITECIQTEAFSVATWDTVGEASTWDGANARHVSALVESVSLSSSPPRVVVDVGNGAGWVTADALTRLGCDVLTLNAQPDGRFPGRPSEPTAETLTALQAQVAGSEAVLGIAHDGDADRMMAVDETGAFVPGDELLALFALQAATAGDSIAAPLNTSLLVDDALASIDATVVRTKVGDVHVADAATDDGVVFGGEPSGAWIWPAETLCPDGPLAAVTLVELVDARGVLSSQREKLGSYPLRRDSVSVGEKARVFERVTSLVSADYSDVQTLDGVRVETDSGWFLIRPSGTQPLIRVTAEARSADRCDELFTEAMDFVRTARTEADSE